MRISDWSSDVCSSDLVGQRLGLAGIRPHAAAAEGGAAARVVNGDDGLQAAQGIVTEDDLLVAVEFPVLENRSEEHTSELQSLMRISYAVFCLKKKNSTTQTLPHITSSPTSHPLSHSPTSSTYY